MEKKKARNPSLRERRTSVEPHFGQDIL